MATTKLSEKAAKAIRALLEDQKHTQEWLANETGIPPRTLARRLHPTNASSMSLDEMDAIAAAFGVGLVQLVAAAKSNDTAVPAPLLTKAAA